MNIHIVHATAYDIERKDDAGGSAAVVSAGKGFGLALPVGHGEKEGVLFLGAYV